MEMPRPTEAHKKLQKLAGDWTGEEIMHPSPWAPQGGKANGRTRCKMALGDLVVITDYEQERGGQITFTGHGIYTYSAEEKCYVLYWFDCMGMRPNLFKGNFEGDVLTLISDGSGAGGPRFSRATYDLRNPGELKSKMEISQDRETWKVFMEAGYTRKR